jgi:hypothetical protein
LEGVIICQSREFSVASLGPAGDLIINNVNFLVFFLEKLIFFFLARNISSHFYDILILEFSFSVTVTIILNSLGFNSKVMKSFSQVIVFFFEVINLSVTLSNICEKLSVLLLSGQESSNEILNIFASSSGIDSFESLINWSRVSHFIIHLLFHEFVPQVLDVKVVSHFKFTLILILVGSCLSDFLILSLSLNSSLDRLFFVSNTFLELSNSFRSILLLL